MHIPFFYEISLLIIMNQLRKCPYCGGMNPSDAKFCSFCGAEILPPSPDRQPSQQADAHQTQPYSSYSEQTGSYASTERSTISHTPMGSSSSDSSSATFDRVVAAALALIFGFLGAHHFYLGNIRRGILYVCFCWTAIPGIIGFIEGIIYLTETNEEFEAKHVIQQESW